MPEPPLYELIMKALLKGLILALPFGLLLSELRRPRLLSFGADASALSKD